METQSTDRIESFLSERKVEMERRIAFIRSEVGSDCRRAMEPLFAGFLSKHPGVHAVGWRQSTPSWRDGEECRFEVDPLHLFMTAESFREDGFAGGDENLLAERQNRSAKVGGDWGRWGRESEQDRSVRLEREAAEGRARVAEIDALIETFGGGDAFAAALKGFAALRQTLRRMDPSLMETAFGETVEVLYVREGFVIGRYDDF